eukprot:CAMPEP_0167750490 /NCGR_PEP_ID=MMETSP0110_2-20121227/6023_1 /TAXON_ID=629695 /ORGANISM="Gymnochlora sp., Strain CCMP2014" /LENGTH=615 /DNA_ID=CAMNT_0007635823 /DNA_START=54 /DNA_END=1898 /DNA_ORIENTATION=-
MDEHLPSRSSGRPVTPSPRSREKKYSSLRAASIPRSPANARLNLPSPLNGGAREYLGSKFTLKDQTASVYSGRSDRGDRHSHRRANGERRRIKWKASLVFILFGMGPGWIVDNALYQQVPWFQQTQPEGLRLASHMAIAGIVAVGTLIPIYYVAAAFLEERIPYIKLVAGLTSLEALLPFIAGITWKSSVGNVSLSILAVEYFASAIGAMQTVIVVPWLLREYNPRVVSLVMIGNHIGSVFTSFLAFGQSPGEKQRFNPTIFFMIVFFVVVLAIPALHYIHSRKLCKRPDQSREWARAQRSLARRARRRNRSKSPKEYKELGRYTIAPASNADKDTALHIDSVRKFHSGSIESKAGAMIGIDQSGTASMAGVVLNVSTLDDSAKIHESPSLNSSMAPSILDVKIEKIEPKPDETLEEIVDVISDVVTPHASDSTLTRLLGRCFIYTCILPQGWKAVVPHAVFNSIVQLIAWSLLRAVAPYAAYHTKHHHNAGSEDDIGGGVLALAVEISFIALTLGSLFSYYIPTTKFLTVTLTIIGLFLLLVIIATDFGDWTKSDGAPVVIICISAIRFLDGYISPLLFRDIEKVAPENREELSRWVAGIEKVVNFVGAWVAYW